MLTFCTTQRRSKIRSKNPFINDYLEDGEDDNFEDLEDFIVCGEVEEEDALPETNTAVVERPIHILDGPAIKRQKLL